MTDANVLTLKTVRQPLVVIDANLAGSSFTDVNLAGATFTDVNLSNATLRDVNLSGVAIADGKLDGMTINGVPVTELFTAYRAAKG